MWIIEKGWRLKILYHFFSSTHPFLLPSLNWIADSNAEMKKEWKQEEDEMRWVGSEAVKMNWLTLWLHGAHWNHLEMLIFSKLFFFLFLDLDLVFSLLRQFKFMRFNQLFKSIFNLHNKFPRLTLPSQIYF